MERDKHESRVKQVNPEDHYEGDIMNQPDLSEMNFKDTHTSELLTEVVKVLEVFEKTDNKKCIEHTMKVDGTEKKKRKKKKKFLLEHKREDQNVEIKQPVRLAPIKKAEPKVPEYESTKPDVLQDITEIKRPVKLVPIKKADAAAANPKSEVEEEQVKEIKRPVKLASIKKADTSAAYTKPEIIIEPVNEIKRPLPLPPIRKADNTAVLEPEVRSTAKITKPEVRVVKKVDSGCLGFIGTCWVKRKENRRSKKRKAIEARKSKSDELIVVSDKKATSGGISFTVDLKTDTRPVRKSVLPPIRQRNGPVRVASEQRLENAISRREKHLNKKRENARAHSKLVRHRADKRKHNEHCFHPKNAHCKSIWDEDYDDDLDIIFGNSLIKGSPSIKIVEHEPVMDEDNDDDLDIVFGTSSSIASTPSKKNGAAKIDFHPKNAHCKSIWDEDYDDDLDIIYGNSSIKGSPSIKIVDDKAVMDEGHDDDLDIVFATSSSIASTPSKKNGASKMEFHPKNAHCISIWDEDYDDDLDIIYGNSLIKGSPSIKIANDKQVMDKDHDDDLDIVFGDYSKMGNLTSSKNTDCKLTCDEYYDDDADIVFGVN